MKKFTVVMREFTAAILAIVLLTTIAYGQNFFTSQNGTYEEQLKTAFNKRCVFSEITRPYSGPIPGNDLLGFTSIFNNPTGRTDDEGIKNFIDYVAKIMATSAELNVLSRLLYQVNGTVQDKFVFENLIFSPQQPSAGKVIITSGLVAGMIKGIPTLYASPEMYPSDYNYFGRSQYTGFLYTNIGVFSSMGMGVNGNGLPFNVMSMDMGSVEFTFIVKTVTFLNGGQQMYIAADCYARPFWDVPIKFYLAKRIRVR